MRGGPVSAPGATILGCRRAHWVRLLALLVLGVVFLGAEVNPASAQVVTEEAILEQEEEGSDSSVLAELLADLRARPLDVNRATVADLVQLPWLTPMMAARIVAFRRLRGRIQSVDELLELPSMDEDLLATIAPYIVVLPAPALRWGEARLRASGRLERSRGMKTGLYPGSPLRLYTRVRCGVGEHLVVGGLLEKDPGERRVDDYGNLFAAALFPKRATTVVVGHYQAEAGQGLVLWSPYAHAKGSETTVAAMRKARGVRPYTSATEYEGLRGLAVETMLWRLHVIALASDMPLDANLNDEGLVTSFYESGLHRTASEQTKRHAVHEKLVGGRVAYAEGEVLSVGMTCYTSRFDRSVQPPDSGRRRFAFRGKRNQLVGADFTFNFASVLFFGEAARSSGGGIAALGGMLVELPRFRFIAHLRHYEPDFYNRHARPFASTTGVANNEQGFYLGAQWRPRPGTRLAFCYDTSKRPWRTYAFPLPASAEDGLVQVEQRLLPGVVGLCRLRWVRNPELTSVVDPFSREIAVVDVKSRLNVRMQVTLHAAPNFSLRSRVEKSRVLVQPQGLTSWRGTTANGLLVAQDVVVRVGQRLAAQTGFVQFDTESYDSRIYMFESDLPGVLTNRAFVGRGTHFYLLLRVQLARKVLLGAKLSSTYYDDRQAVGSGLDQTAGPFVRVACVQVDVSP
ncbi:MAG: ComEA family DNA-binding protein [Candidatus Oleimicrobiaceae bacterium]